MKAIRITIKPSDLTLRNEMHFDVQRTNRAHIYRNRKHYNRNIDKQNYRRDF